jgi:hypothetical protein
MTPFWILIIFSFSLIKIWLILPREIITVNGYYDQLRFVEMAGHIINGEWLGSYDLMALLRKPIYPLWISLNHFLGLPLRIGTEILFLASAMVFVRSLSRCCAWWLSVLIYVLIVFHPMSFWINDYVLTETIYVSLLMLSAGTVIFYITGFYKRTLLFLLGVFLGLAFNSRPEHILIWVYLLLFALSALVQNNIERFSIFKEILRRFSFPFLGILLISSGICATNYFYYGVFTSSDFFAKGFSKAHRALLRIESEERRRYVSFPKDVREKAYQVSPTFNQLKPFLEEGSLRDTWINIGCSQANICDDYGDSWFLFVLRDAARAAGQFRSARETDLFFQSIGSEISEACNNRLMPCQNHFFNYLNPEFLGYLKYLPMSFIEIFKVLFSVRDYVPLVADNKLPDVKVLYDDVLNRRESLNERLLDIGGWAFSKDFALANMELLNSRGAVVYSSSNIGTRADVEEFFIKEKAIKPPEKMEFKETMYVASHFDLLDSKIKFRFVDGTTVKVDLKLNEYFSDDLNYAIDSLSLPKDLRSNPASRRVIIFAFLNESLFKIVRSCFFLLSPFLLLRLFMNGYHYRDGKAYVVNMLVILCVVRISFLTMVDAFSFRTAEMRYLYPIIPFVYSLMALGIYDLSRVIFNFLRRRECRNTIGNI